MVDFLAVQQRLYNWCQTSETRLSGESMASAFIERVGVATLYPASPEFPNLFSAYVGDPHTKTDSGWETPSGEVYGWRWTLGRSSAAFYTTLIRRRPTWIRWSLLPAILRLCGVLRPPEELYEAGHLSIEAYRIVQTLEAAMGALALMVSAGAVWKAEAQGSGFTLQITNATSPVASGDGRELL